MITTPIETRWYRQGYQEGVREAEARTIERCAQVALDKRYRYGWEIADAIRALKDSKQSAKQAI